MDDVIRGAAAGFAGTAVMTAAMAAAKAAGLVGGETPPRQVVRNLEESAGVRDDLSRPAFEASWLAAHFAYGSAAGAAYERARRALPLPEPFVSGAAFGLALWAFGYGGWTPALGLTPPPRREPRRKVATEVVTHLVFATTTAMVARALRGSGDGTGAAWAGRA